MVLLSGAVMLTTLVSAKTSLQQTVLAKSQTAMSDATQDFVGWAAAFVAKNGPDQKTSAWASPSTAITEPVCPQSASAPTAGPAPCNYLATITWRVTGASADGAAVSNEGQDQQPTSLARNLAETIDEQRISATISVRLTDNSGTTLLATRSREVTARLINSDPYIVVTGVRDIASGTASITSTEGDTGGAGGTLDVGVVVGDPSSNLPASYVDTRIQTTVDCVNSSSTFDQSNPTAPIDGRVHQYIDHRFHQWGNQDWEFENPCAPTYLAKIVTSSTIPPDAKLPEGSVYATNPSANDNAPWQKRDESPSSFAR